jgi:hypothetical protein
MAFKNVRIFPFTAKGSDGYPTVSAPVKLITPGTGEAETNGISCSLTMDKASKTLEADDKQEKHTSVLGGTGSLEVYGADPDGIVALGLAKKDSNGNLIFPIAENKQHVALFFSGGNEKGKKYQTWVYDCVFQPLDEAAKTQIASETADSIKLSFTVYPITTATWGDTLHERVFEGNTGYVLTNEPAATDLYKGPVSGT